MPHSFWKLLWLNNSTYDVQTGFTPYLYGGFRGGSVAGYQVKGGKGGKEREGRKREREDKQKRGLDAF